MKICERNSKVFNIIRNESNNNIQWQRKFPCHKHPLSLINKTKLFKLPLDSINAINSNNNYIKNNRYNNSYKELQMPLTDRKEKEIDDNKNIEANELRNSLKNINRKKLYVFTKYFMF